MIIVTTEDVAVASEAGDGGVQGGVTSDTAQTAGVPLPFHCQQVKSVDDPPRTASAEGGLGASFPTRGYAGNSPAGGQTRPWGADT